MAQLSLYGERVIDRINMIGMWLSVLVCCRNFIVCYRQYKRTRGRIHLVNIAQVVVFMIYRFLYGLIPLFEVTTCAYYPLLVSLWHLDYLLFYVVMFMRLLILESDKNSRWIKIVGFVFILIRFADWPYELAFLPEENALQSSQLATEGTTCWAMWANGVIILNFIGDCLCNLFLSGMFVKRLYSHIRRSRKVMSHHNCIIEYIARKSLIYLALTFVVNLIMNIFKITMFLGDRSDAFTVYFAIIESTLLVEALRVDHPGIRDQNSCQQCANSNLPEISMHPRRRRWKRDSDDEANIPDIIYTNPNYPDKVDVDAIQLKPTGLSKTISLVNKNIPFYSPSASYQTSTVPHYHLKSAATVQQTSSAPPFAPPTQAAPVRPVVRSSGEIEVAPIVSLRSIGLVDQSSWDSSRDKQL